VGGGVGGKGMSGGKQAREFPKKRKMTLGGTKKVEGGKKGTAQRHGNLDRAGKKKKTGA